MSNLNTRPIIADDFEKYDRFIHENGSLFASRQWLALLDGQTTILGLFDGGNQLIATWAVNVSRRWGLRMVLRPPLTPAGGPYFAKDVKQTKNAIETQRTFMEGVCSHIARVKPAICYLPVAPGVNDCLAFRWQGYKVIPAYTYQINLSQTSEKIIQGFSSTRRRNIRATIRDQIEIRQVDSFEAVESLTQNTFDRQSKQMPLHMVKRILYEFATPHNSFAYVAYQGDAAIACVFCVYDRTTAYYLIGGYDASNAHHGAGAASMEQAILKAKDLGLKIFDFEGSVIPAIEKYFRGFGGVLTPYLTVNRAWLPIEIALKFRKRELF